MRRKRCVIAARVRYDQRVSVGHGKRFVSGRGRNAEVESRQTAERNAALVEQTARLTEVDVLGILRNNRLIDSV